MMTEFLSLKKMSLKRLLMTSLLFTGLVPAASITYMAFIESSSSLKNEVSAKLVSLRSSSALQLEREIEIMRKQVSQMGTSDDLVRSFIELKEAWKDLDKSLDESQYQSAREKLKAYYQKNFLDKFNTINQEQLEPKNILETLDERGLILQASYIMDNPNPVGEKHMRRWFSSFLFFWA